MNKTNRKGSSSGRRDTTKSFGAKPWERDSGTKDSRRMTMHKAICGQCGNGCEVPFKPNGTKEVLCNLCFRGTPDQKRPTNQSARRSITRDKMNSRGDGQYEEQFRVLNAKLDMILKSLK